MEIYANIDRETRDAMEEIRQEGISVDHKDESLSTVDDEDDEGWEDLEPDVEKVLVQSLFDEKTFPDVPSMLHYCLEIYEFDFLEIRRELGM